MRYVRIRNDQGAARWGQLEGRIVKLLDRAPWAHGVRVTGELRFLSRRLLAPVTPKKIVGLALNYRQATDESKNDKEPLVFIKPASSVIGPNEEIQCPFAAVKVWGECELAIVLRRSLKEASPEEARRAIFGYTLANDVTAENVLGRDHHLARSKAVDSFCPIGPWVDTDFIPGEQLLQGWHNEVLLRESPLSRRIMKDVDTLVWLSTWLTLHSGDIILTGAPPRVRDRMFLNNGDIYTCRLEGIGTLENSFRLAAS